jgi:hypothetical protein
MDAPSLERLGVQVVMVSEGLQDVEILLLEAKETEQRVIARLDAQEKSWVLLQQEMQALDMRNTGLVSSELKLKQVLKSVQLLLGLILLNHSLKHQKRWVT